MATKGWIAALALALTPLPATSAVRYFVSATTQYVATNDFAACGAGSCANFTAAMRVSANFTTAAPLAANLAAVEISPQVVAFHGTDGLTAYTRPDPNVRTFQIIVSTDASGNLTDASIIIERWQGGTAPHALGDRFDYMVLTSGFQAAFHNQRCGGFGAAPSGQADVCVIANPDGSSSDASGATALAFAARAVPAAPVPALGPWALALMALALAAAGLPGLRTRA